MLTDLFHSRLVIASSPSILLIAVAWMATIYCSRRAIIAVDITRNLAQADLSKPSFQIVDFMALFMMLQIPILLTSQAVRADQVSIALILFWGGLYSLVYIGIWWWGAAALSAIQVSNAWRRGIFLGLLQPLGMILGITAGLILWLSFSLSEVRPAISGYYLLGVLVYSAVAIGYSYACHGIRAGSRVT